MSHAAGNTAPQFVSKNELNDSQKRREKEIREAYARYRLQEAKAIQDEKLEEMFKLRNQFRGLDESESQFLEDIHRARQKREEAKRNEEAKELEKFRRYDNETDTSAAETKGSTVTAPAPDKTLIPTIPKRTDAPAKRKRGKENALGIVRKTTVPPRERAPNEAETTGTQARKDAETPATATSPPATKNEASSEASSATPSV
ncbi:hypothetical protein MEQU1_001333 [Malassezia equina]|uniref:FAM192A/Fyv6 N-terminal domain-containing protein n=1 Tax=Malassezia equina TaxID=1381935 RepID=A0AAF0IY66_9BASI|nr:hypothetical protein MEQU1_001333 [Malassezia equina]